MLTVDFPVPVGPITLERSIVMLVRKGESYPDARNQDVRLLLLPC